MTFVKPKKKKSVFYILYISISHTAQVSIYDASPQ